MASLTVVKGVGPGPQNTYIASYGSLRLRAEYVGSSQN